MIFFLTDADLMTNGDVNEILTEIGKAPKPGGGAGGGLAAGLRGFVNSFRQPAEVRKTRIQVIEFGRGPQADKQTPLRRLAATTGGSYVYVDVTKFPRPVRN